MHLEGAIPYLLPFKLKLPILTLFLSCMPQMKILASYGLNASIMNLEIVSTYNRGIFSKITGYASLN